MHICFSTIDYHQKAQGGGIASYLDALCPALVKLGHQVSIVGPGKEKKDFVNKHGVRIIQRPLGSIHWYAYRLKIPGPLYLLLREWEWSRKLFVTVLKLHKETPIDLIESTEVGLWKLVSNRKLIPPVIVRLHGSPFIFQIFSGHQPTKGEKLMHLLELRWLKKVSAVNAPGQFQADYYQRLLGRDVKAIANPLAYSFLSNNEPGIKNTKIPKILYTGRIEYVKGTLVLVKAFGLLLKKFPKAELIIVGARHNSISEREWQNAIKDSGIECNIKLTGHIPFEFLQSYYYEANIFVMPSYYETFGISVIEAMVHGLPVVASNAGALPELITHFENGILTTPGDAKELCRAMETILLNEELACNMAIANRKKVLEKYTPQAIALKTIAWYKEKV
jgi:glycosyltransferase involved in cell wall biosynthesis